MSIGYWIVQGDKTSCGGSVLEGHPKGTKFGPNQNRQAVNGSKVSCGKHPGVYSVGGGHLGEIIHGCYAASTLYSRSTCPCKAFFIPTHTWAKHGPYQGDTRIVTPVTVPMAATPVAPAPPEFEEPVQHAQTAKKLHKEETKREPVDAGFCVLPYGAEAGAYERYLFESEPPAGTRELYRSLNGEGKEYKAGSILLVVDPEKQDSDQIAHMQAAKQRIDAALEPLTHKEANFLHEHYATIANFSNIADKGIGLAADPVGKYFENIEKILKEIQETYKNTYMTKGALIGEQFHVKRAQLFNELDRVLKVGFLNKGMKLGEYSNLKSALGLSTKSITHKWNETGISDIEGYATNIERAAKYVAAMRYVGYVGIGFSALHSINEINEACSVGREDECTKKKYTEIGSFSGGLIGGIGGGAIGTGICTVVLGALTIEAAGAGALACGVILGTGGGYIGGEFLSDQGENLGELIYKTVGE
ncbi:PAAR domain-containing protein [Enterobacter cloacae complex sp. ECC445]|uniref:PAAR domain-containing protein n=1 Tax=Enterobacter cloacae complex sp. ECC445 TaxID=2913213 RepID=UPI001F32583C|nr:PAAR domain-containing protein [Enterobacter cloacae complex sp. ECC445]MCG0456134.1 PAAR domain-containing protein [Enterobacter cloacae complex sp. ECC445]